MAHPAYLIRGVLTLGAAQLLSWVGASALAVLLPRYLGDANLGKLTFALAVTQIAGLLTDLGTATYLTKEVARGPSQTGALTTAALLMRLPLSLLASAAVLVVATVAVADPLARQIAYVLCLAILFDALSKVVLGSLQGMQQIKALAACSLLSKLSYAGLAALMLFNGAGPLEVAVAYVVGLGLGLALATVLLARRVRLAFRPERVVWRQVLVGGLPFFVWQAALLVYGQVDAVLLAVLTQDAVVGWYAAAYRIAAIPLFIPVVLMTVLFPALSATSTHVESFNALARRAVQTVVLVSLPIALGTMLLPDKLIQVFDYPEAFANSIVPMILLAADLPLGGVDMMIGTVLNARDRQRQWALTAVAAAILNPSLNLLAIPYTQATYGNGAIGAAAVTTLTELFMFVVGLRLLPAGTLTRSTAAYVFRCLLAGLAMAGGVWLVREQSILVSVTLGAILYGVCSLALRTMTISGIQEVRLRLLRRDRAANGALAA